MSFRSLGAVAMVGLAMLLAACSTTRRLGAAEDVHALLISIRDGDQAAFDRHVDRVALRRQLEARLLQEADRSDRSGRLSGVAAIFAGPLAEVAANTLLRPRVFRAVAEYYGYRPDQPIPPPVAIATRLRALPDGRVCATRASNGPCVVTFAREDGSWRLVSFDGDRSMLNIR
jgi:hypothetical protein